MGVILTKKYAHLLEKKGLNRVWHFILSSPVLLIDISKNGKLRELVSFAIWELKSKLRLFAKNEYIVFDESTPYILKEDDDLKKLDFSIALKRYLFEIQRTQSWKVSYTNTKGTIYGCLATDDTVLYKSEDGGKSIERVTQFEQKISSIFINSDDVLFVNTLDKLYRSDDAKFFKLTLTLTHKECYIFHLNGMTELPSGVLLIGEYGNVPIEGKWANVAHVYASYDGGKTWEKSDFLKKMGVNKHVHLVAYSKHLNRVLLADGDNLKKFWISTKVDNFNLKREKWRLVNRFHIQLGGYTSMVEIDEQVILGTDYLGGTNFLVMTQDAKIFSKKVIPNPYRKSPVMDLVKRTTKEGSEEVWAVLNNANSTKAKSLLMCSKNAGKSWSRVIEYDGTKNLIRISSGSYATNNTLTLAITPILSKPLKEGSEKPGVGYIIQDK